MATLTELLEYNEQNDFYPEEAVKAFYENGDYSTDEASDILREFSDAYLGCYEDLEHYAREFLDSTGELLEIPENLRYYFDYASFGRDLEYGGDIWQHQIGFAETFIFRNN